MAPRSIQPKSSISRNTKFSGLAPARAHAIGLADRPSAGPIHITVAVVVGFIALLGIATDDGVVIATYLEQSFAHEPVGGVQDIRERVLAAGLRRARPCLMTTMTTILALAPILGLVYGIRAGAGSPLLAVERDLGALLLRADVPSLAASTLLLATAVTLSYY